MSKTVETPNTAHFLFVFSAGCAPEIAPEMPDICRRGAGGAGESHIIRMWLAGEF